MTETTFLSILSQASPWPPILQLEVIKVTYSHERQNDIIKKPWSSFIRDLRLLLSDKPL